MKWLVLALVFFSTSVSANKIWGDALLAKVGRDPIFLSDLQRYQSVSKILSCAKLRENLPAEESNIRFLLNRYLEEELVAIEARSKRASAVKLLTDATATIHSNPRCSKAWQDLGKNYSKLWSSPQRPREGESMLVRELEKRMLVDRFLKTEGITERGIWIREAKIKNPVKIYLD